MNETLDDVLHILHIDDDPAMRKLVTEIMNMHGHVLISCGSAEEGLTQLPYYTFHVAFLDQNLPGMEGLIFGEYLRANNPDMAIALVTGEVDARLERASERLDIRYIAKPFDVGELLDVVDAYREGAERRYQQRVAQADRDYAPRFHAAVGDWFDMPGIPERIQERLFRRVAESLRNLGSVHRYTEKDRTTALSGIIAAKVLGLVLPKAKSGRRYDVEFDALMQLHGRRTEFDAEVEDG